MSSQPTDPSPADPSNVPGPDGGWPAGFEPPPRPGSETLAQLMPELEAQLESGIEPIRRPRWLIRGALSAIALGLLLFGVGTGLSACQAGRLLEESQSERPRDPLTGIIEGAEERRLGPVDAPAAVLLLHGYSSSPRDWAGLPEALATAGWAVHVPLLPGHGTHPEDLAATTNADLRTAVRAEFDALAARHERVVVAGFSMGGALATELAAERPVERLVLVAPYYRVTRPWFSPISVERANRWAGALIDYVPAGKGGARRIKKRENSGEIINYWALPTASVDRLGKLGREASARAGEVTCPTWMVLSTHDAAASPSAARAVFDALATEDKQLLEVAESDHILLWDYDAEEILDAITELLGSP
jgi:carboxylesterase